jgi:uncharacterized protein
MTISTERLRAVLNGFLGNERPAYLFHMSDMGLVTDETLRDLLCEVWTQAWPSFSLREEDWLEMFTATGFVSLRATKPTESIPQPTQPLTIYRGAALSTSGRGFSWTLSHPVAEIYAQLLALSGIASGVFETTVPADAVLAMIEEDCVTAGEDEVVIDPRRLCDSSRPKLVEAVNVGAVSSNGDTPTPPEWGGLLARVVTASPRAASSPLHGVDHWRRVAHVGRELAHETPGADERVVVLFALFHDAMRENEDDDPGHGERGAQLARELYAEGVLDLDAGQMEKLVLACRTHTDGTISTDATVGVCFDADRLDLGRVGIRPEPSFLSTDAARRLAMLEQPFQRLDTRVPMAVPKLGKS